MTTRDRIRNWASLALFVVGVGLVSYWVGATIDAHVFQSRLAERLESLSPSQSPPAFAHATRREANTNGLVGRLELPRLGLSAMITEGIGDQALGRGIGHVPGTPFPGERGNVALAAHRDTYFRRLKDVAQGDHVRLSTPDGVFSYEVEWVQVVKPDRIDLLEDTHGPALTLVTCYPFNWIGSAPKRFVVRCRQIGEPVPAEPLPAVVVAASSTDEPATLPIAVPTEIEIDVGLDSMSTLPEADPTEIR